MSQLNEFCPDIMACKKLDAEPISFDKEGDSIRHTEFYGAGCHSFFEVGEKFGCVHFEDKGE